MIIQRTMKYREGYLPSPRHRKERYREVEDLFTAELTEISTADPYCEAHLVFRVHDYDVHAEGIQVTNYRMYDDQLYRPMIRGRYFNCNDAEYWLPVLSSEIADKIHVPCSCAFSKSEVAMKYQEEADRYLIIDGVVWVKTSEPFYYVETFGLGNNHGGTSLLIDRTGGRMDYYHTYSALQREEAVKAAIQVALERGDTEAVPCLQKNDRYIEVLDPDAVQFQRMLRTFIVEKTTTCEVAIKAVNYGHAIDLAKQLPTSCYKEVRASYRPDGTTENASVFYTEEDVKVLAAPSVPVMMRNMAENIVKHLENCGFDDCTDCTGYLLLRNFGNKKERLVDVYKSTGNGADIPHYVICCRYEDGNADFMYTADLSVDSLAEKLEEFYNAPVDDGAKAEASDAVVATEPRNALEISKMMTLSTAHIAPNTAKDLEKTARCEFPLNMLSCNVPFPVYKKGDYGYFIYVTEDTISDALIGDFCPSDLLDVAIYAENNGCNLLCLDGDGPTVPDLKTYEW